MTLALAILLLAAADPMEDASKARAEGRLDDAIALYQKALQSKPDSGEAWWYLGLCLYDRERYSEAEAAFAQLTRIHPDRGAGWAMRGLCQYRTRQYTPALDSLRRAHALGLPPSEELMKVARYHLAVLLNHAGEHEIATGLLMSFVAQNAVTPLVKQAAGQAALRIGSIPDELPSGDRDAVRLAGEAAVLAWQKRVAAARKPAGELIERFPTRPNVHYLMGYLLLLENRPESIAWFEKELAVSPAHVPARLQIAYEHLRRGEAAKGLPFAERAVKLAPDNFLARDIAGRLYLDLGRIPDSIRELETAVRLAPNSAEAHLHLATAYNRAGRKQDAARHRAIFERLNKGGDN